DLIRQLDEAIAAMLAGSSAPVRPEVNELVRIAGYVRNLPDRDFRKRLKEVLMQDAVNQKRDAAKNWIPEGFHTLTPYLHPADAAGLIDFLKATFRAEE